MLISIAAISYGLGAIGFLALSIAVSKHTHHYREAPPLFLPSAVSALWCTITALQAQFGIGYQLANLAELARDAAWLWFLAHSLKQLKSDSAISPWLQQIFRTITLLVVLGMGLHAVALAWPIRFLGFLGYVILPALLSVAGMVLVEQFYRNARSQDRWGIKFLCLALGGMFVYDFYLYSEAMLFRELPQNMWAARGAVNILFVPLIWLSAIRTPAYLPVAISHRMVFHTVTLVATGLYLILMAVAGYYIRLMGGSWGTFLQTLFMFGAGLVLVVVVFSGSVRAKLRVFLSKHFFRYRYDYREEWLRFTHALTAGQPGSRLCERSIEAIARLVDSPAGALWLRRDDGTFYKVAHWNWVDLDGKLSADAPLATFLEKRQWVINLAEYREDPAGLEEASPPDWLLDTPRAWLVIPMLWHDRLLGFMVLAESLGKVGIDWEISDLLKTAARQASTNLAQMQATEALMVARQFESFNRAAAFVIHDIKNLVAQLSLLLANAEKHKHKPEFQEDMLATIESSVARMNRMLTKLRDKRESVGLGLVDMSEVLKEVVASKKAFSLQPELNIQGDHLLVRADKEKLARVIGHLLQNAIEATPYTGRVSVKLFAGQSNVMVVVEDTGCGMDAAFIRDQLFKPFVSTKGTGMGIGAYECKAYIEELEGDIRVDSTPGRGTCFTVRLPMAERKDDENKPNTAMGGL